jgi:Glycosyl transferases group 1
MAPMRVLGLAAYPALAASTRFRMTQYEALFAARGINLETVPFLDEAGFKVLYSTTPPLQKALVLAKNAARYLGELVRARAPDVVWIQREATLLGPEIVERVVSSLHRAPCVLDVDDAIWLTPPRDGSKNPPWTEWLRDRPKVDRLAKRAAAITVGSSALAAHFEGRATVIPTVPSRSRFTPGARGSNAVPVIGWMGSHSTAPFMSALAPVFERLRSAGHRFSVQMVGGEVAGIPSRPFELSREVEDLQSFDIGVAPMPRAAWTDGKCGFKQLLYMATGAACVTSPWAAASDFIAHERNALVATDEAAWFQALARLLTDPALRRTLSEEGRALIESSMCAELQVDRIAEALLCA